MIMTWLENEERLRDRVELSDERSVGVLDAVPL